MKHRSGSHFMKDLKRILAAAVLNIFLLFLTACAQKSNYDLPVLETLSTFKVTMTTATAGGNIISGGGGEISARGVCWSTDEVPTTDDLKTFDGTGEGSFMSILTGLQPATKYYLRAYAENKAGTSYGNQESFTTSTEDPQTGGQIIADHRVVSEFDKIPQNYIDLVKKMWVVIAGESHSEAYRNGLMQLETSNPAYAVSVIESGTPEPFTAANLRASRATWGDLTNSSGWIYDYGEEDWFASETAINRTKAGLSYCNSSGLNLTVFGYGWCSDPDIDVSDFITATQNYIDHCKSNGYPTKVIFTTGTVDDYEPLIYGYNKSLRNITIREYVAADASRVLFDYADILCHDENGNLTTKTYEGNTFPVITDTNLGNADIGHIGPAGALRLGKAMWWMLARIAGWDGK